MADSNSASRRLGSWQALGAFVIWGILPVYWKTIGHLGVLPVVGHRVLWSFLLLAPLLAWRGTLGVTLGAFRTPRVLAAHVVSGLLLGLNWYLFILATLTDRVLEAAFGYFLNPLLNVAVGWFLLGEKRDRRQWIAVVLAASGVLVQARADGGFPWIAIGLAVSFAAYALARKKSPLESLEGLAVETVLMTPAAIVLLLLAPTAMAASWTDRGMLVGSGLVTALPLLLFAAGARRLDLARLGMIQFAAPTLQFLVGHFLYGEPLSTRRLISFAFIWAGVAVFLSGARGAAALARQGGRADGL